MRHLPTHIRATTPMTHHIRRSLVPAIVCSLLVLAASPGAQVATAPTAPATATIVERVDEYMQAELRVNGFSGTILLARKGAPIVAKGYGAANAEWSIPNTPRTKFRLGSITKQFTSMAVMQLQQQGKLKVQDPVCQYLTPCPATWKPITIHHLLTHSSGIPSYTNSPSYLTTMMVPKTVDQMVAGFRDLPLEFEPGSQYKYNNSGYFLLGVLLEKVTGQPYERVLADQIFTPLGMADSGYDSPARILPLRASGYSRQGSASTNAPYLDMAQPFAAGALYSTVEDLLKWDQALYTDKLLPSAARTEMFTPFKGNYAYGWQVPSPSPQTFGRRQVAHGGGINGFSTMIIRLPEENVTSIVLSNVQQAQTGRIARDLLAILFGEPYKVAVARTVASIDPKVYDAYVGRYQLSPTFILTVTREGDRLMTQATGQSKLEVFPESETKYFLKVVDAQLTFVKDEGGSVIHVILHQGGKDQKAAKMP
jgi:CubicO group peptidase (beta-lactamase class C family)